MRGQFPVRHGLGLGVVGVGRVAHRRAPACLALLPRQAALAAVAWAVAPVDGRLPAALAAVERARRSRRSLLGDVDVLAALVPAAGPSVTVRITVHAPGGGER